VSVEAGGTISVVELKTKDGQELNLSAGEDLVVMSDINVGSGSISLSADSSLVLGGTVTASNLNLSTGSDLTLNSKVDNLNVDMKGEGSVSITQEGNVHIGKLNSGGRDVNLIIDGDVKIDELGGIAGEVNIVVVGGNIIITNNQTGDVPLNLAGQSMQPFLLTRFLLLQMAILFMMKMMML
jgi:Protein of unknown function (DUF2807).